MHLFEDYGTQGSPGTWVPFKVAQAEIPKMREFLTAEKEVTPDDFPNSALLRIRPLTLDEEIEINRYGQSARESIKLHVRNGFRQKKGEREAQAEIGHDPAVDMERKVRRAIKALVEIGWGVNVKTQTAAEAWSKALGRPVGIGPLDLRGEITPEAKRRFVMLEEGILEFVLRTSDLQKTIADETLEEEEKN